MPGYIFDKNKREYLMVLTNEWFEINETIHLCIILLQHAGYFFVKFAKTWFFVENKRKPTLIEKVTYLHLPCDSTYIVCRGLLGLEPDLLGGVGLGDSWRRRGPPADRLDQQPLTASRPPILPETRGQINTLNSWDLAVFWFQPFMTSFFKGCPQELFCILSSE